MTHVETAMPMVTHIARKMARRLPPQADLNDLVQDGMVGLLEAAARYDETRGATLRTFASKRVHGAILDGCRLNDPLSRKERRKRGSGVADPQLSPAEADRTPAETVDAIEAAWIRKRLSEMEPRDRFVLTAKYYEDTEDAAIARALGVHPSRVSQIHVRALRRLRRAS
jgi:RNA polymerase sigma factor (sigma-70 family)